MDGNSNHNYLMCTRESSRQCLSQQRPKPTRMINNHLVSWSLFDLSLLPSLSFNFSLLQSQRLVKRFPTIFLWNTSFRQLMAYISVQASRVRNVPFFCFFLWLGVVRTSGVDRILRRELIYRFCTARSARPVWVVDCFSSRFLSPQIYCLARIGGRDEGTPLFYRWNSFQMACYYFLAFP